MNWVPKNTWLIIMGSERVASNLPMINTWIFRDRPFRRRTFYGCHNSPSNSSRDFFVAATFPRCASSGSETISKWWTKPKAGANAFGKRSGMRSFPACGAISLNSFLIFPKSAEQLKWLATKCHTPIRAKICLGERAWQPIVRRSFVPASKNPGDHLSGDEMTDDEESAAAVPELS